MNFNNSESFDAMTTVLSRARQRVSARLDQR
jgi:hypothetical protein